MLNITNVSSSDIIRNTKKKKREEGGVVVVVAEKQDMPYSGCWLVEVPNVICTTKSVYSKCPRYSISGEVNNAVQHSRATSTIITFEEF